MYREQVDLLLQVLPLVAKENLFALKGGTAINLFVRDMPRLSVDIDLTYLPPDDHDTAMRKISEGLNHISQKINHAIPRIKTQLVKQGSGKEAKLTCQSPSAQIKIEVNTIIRGHVFPPRIMDISKSVETEFKKFVSINVLSHAELFGGKICAALDRQHPRDMFDIHQLFEHEEYTPDIRLGFMTMLISHSRPIHELINPNLLDQKTVFQHQFTGMTFTAFSYDDYESTRSRLIKSIHDHLTDTDKSFLISFKSGTPDWELLPLENLRYMPAVQWKLGNIVKLKTQNPEKHKAPLKALKNILMAG